MTRLPDEPRIRAWRGLMAVHAAVAGALEDALQEAHSVSLAWYQVLVELRIHGGSLRMHQLAELATLSRSGTTRLVDRIEAEGLVERRACQGDRRGLQVALTEKGCRVQRAAAPLVLRALQQHLGRYLSDAEATDLAETLEAIAAGEGVVAPPIVE